MTFIITATVSASVAYFVFALICCLHDCLMVRYRRQFSPAPVVTVEPEPVAIAESTTAPAVEPPAELPNSIRGLREFIRENSLQSVIKKKLGKSVSSCTKDELIAAIA